MEVGHSEAIRSSTWDGSSERSMLLLTSLEYPLMWEMTRTLLAISLEFRAETEKSSSWEVSVLGSNVTHINAASIAAAAASYSVIKGLRSPPHSKDRKRVFGVIDREALLVYSRGFFSACGWVADAGNRIYVLFLPKLSPELGYIVKMMHQAVAVFQGLEGLKVDDSHGSEGHRHQEERHRCGDQISSPTSALTLPRQLRNHLSWLSGTCARRTAQPCRPQG